MLLILTAVVSYLAEPAASPGSRFLPERDYTLRSVFAIANPSVVCNVRAPNSEGVETFGSIASPFCILAIL